MYWNKHIMLMLLPWARYDCRILTGIPFLRFKVVSGVKALLNRLWLRVKEEFLRGLERDSDIRCEATSVILRTGPLF